MPYENLYKGRVSNPGQTYLVTIVTEQRSQVFADMACGRIAVNVLREIDTEGASHTLAFVIMPDHVHWLFELQSLYSLDKVLNLFKGRAARRVNIYRHSVAPVWQPAYHDHAMRSEESLVDAARYIIMNPVRAGLVAQIGEYPLWDAVWVAASSGPFRL